ncbi:MAG: AraC family transcriptional regulator [Prolixibacteraceae bacterium]|jgi:AraC-like DNA-binding protein|nr:AraC family transcriptional regulator [Prolixibacteraceae bacterium]
MKKQDGFPGQLSYVIPDKILELVKSNPLTADLYITDIGYYPQARHHFRERKEGVSQAILIYNVEGKGFILAGNEKHELPTDHFYIIPPGMPHSYHADNENPWSIYWVHFAGTKARLFSRKVLQPVSLEREKTSRVNERLELFSELFRNLERGYGIETLEYVNLCLNYLLASFTHPGQFRAIKESAEKDPVGQSINFMLENIGRKLALNDLAEVVDLSASHFSRLFVTRTGHSPIDYFIQLKIQRACRLLDNTDWPIAGVARETGFEDQFYFSRQFRKVMNMSPREYRKR